MYKCATNLQIQQQQKLTNTHGTPVTAVDTWVKSQKSDDNDATVLEFYA